MAENWYKVLELEFDPNPVEDQIKIDERIDEKAKFWASKFNDFNKGPEYRRYHQMIPEIRKAMMDPIERRRMILEACDLTYEPIDKLLKTIGRKGVITEEEIRKIAERQKASPDVVERRRSHLGIAKEASKSADFQAIYSKYYQTKPQNAPAFDGIISMLKSFGANDLYEFLFNGTNIRNASRLPCDALRQRSEERKKKEFYKYDSISGTGSKLCGFCDLAFKDENSKDIYDKYLAHSKLKASLDEAKGVFDISGELTQVQAEGYISQLTEGLKDRKLATDVLEAFCKVEKIRYNTGSSKENSLSLKVCRCGCTNDVSDGRKVCQNCGDDLYIKCPNCGAANDAIVKVCRCGYLLENIGKASALLGLAEHFADSMDFEIARARISDAEKCCPEGERARSSAQYISRREKEAGSKPKQMKEAFKQKRFFEAQKHYQLLRKLFPNFQDLELEKGIEIASESAGQCLKKAREASNENDAIYYCIKAYEACQDYPGVRELVSKYPPKAPSNLRIAADQKSRANILSWDQSASDGMVYYSVVRKAYAVPSSPEDGEAIGKVSMLKFADSSIEPAINYFYAIFAERSGVFSDGLMSSTPAVNLFEATDVTVSAGDSRLELGWGALPKGATAEVYRDSGKGMENMICATASESFLDSGLINDRAYSYRIRLAYQVNGHKQLTFGILASGIPTKPPKAIESLSVRPGAGGLFIASWDNPENSDVELYCSTEKPDYAFGDNIGQKALEAKMSRMALTRLSRASASFQYKGNNLLYIIAAVIKSGSAVLGSMARARKGGDVKITNIATANGKTQIHISPPPPGATGFVALYRQDMAPEGIDDKKASRKHIPLKQYQLYSALDIGELEQKNYYFTVFAEYEKDNEKDYSLGSDYFFANAPKQMISYSIAVSKKLFGSSYIALEFESEEKPFVLPDIDIMSAVGNTPMFKASSDLFYSIPSQTVNERLHVKIPIPKSLPSGTYIKAFLKDELLAPSNQLKLKLKSDFKIS